MIQLPAKLEGGGVFRVHLDTPHRRLFVEVASDVEVDIAVVTEEQFRAFDESEFGDDADIDWVEQVRQYDFECRRLPRGKQYLLIWNSHQEGPATVAYKITAVDDSAPPYPGDVRAPGQRSPQPIG